MIIRASKVAMYEVYGLRRFLSSFFCNNRAGAISVSRQMDGTNMHLHGSNKTAAVHMHEVQVSKKLEEALASKLENSKERTPTKQIRSRVGCLEM